jgi:hypothetical protein
MNKINRSIQVLFWSGLVLLLMVTNTLAKASKIDIYGNKMSADFESIPLSLVINDIGDITGIKFIFLNGAGAVGYNRLVTIKFESVTIRAALERLLSDFNYSFVSDRDDNIKQIFIFGTKAGISSDPKIQLHSSNVVKSGVRSKKEVVESSPDEGVMNIGLPSKEGMNIGPPSKEGMIIGPPSEEGMIIGPPSENAMKIGPASEEGMNIGPPSEKGMEIGPPSTEGM